MAKRFQFIYRNWFRIFIAGLALFIATEQAFKITGIPFSLLKKPLYVASLNSG